MSRYEWLLFLHVSAAFVVVAAPVLLGIGIAVAARSAEPGRAAAALDLTRWSSVCFDVGGLGVLVFGVLLAFDADAYAIWDGWILGALVLWVVAAFAGARVKAPYKRAQHLADRLVADGGAANGELRAAVLDRRALWMQVLAALAVFATLVLMIFKPGAG